MTKKVGITALTVVEVLVALTILGVAIAVLSMTTISSVRHDAVSASRTQAVQVLSYLGRLASVSDPTLTTSSGAWDYGELKDAFPELAVEANRANPGLYRAEFSELGTVGIGQASLNYYRVEVCWQIAGDESCVSGETAGPISVPEDEEGQAPIVN